MNRHERNMAFLAGMVRRHENNKEDWVDHDDLAESLLWISENTEQNIGDLFRNIDLLKKTARELQREENPLILLDKKGVVDRYKLTEEGRWYWRTSGGRKLNFKNIDKTILRVLVDNQDEIDGKSLLREVRRSHPDVNWEILVRRVKLQATATPPRCDWVPLPGDGGIMDFFCTVTLAGEKTLLEEKVEDSTMSEVGKSKNPRRVFVIHGQNMEARNAMFSWLRSLDLKPIEWEEAVKMTQKTSPYIGEILDCAFNEAQAVIALLTDDEEVKLRSSLLNGKDGELGFQSRPNVLFEAGMAMGRCPERTIIVELGQLRPFSDITGIHTVRLNNSAEKREALISRLESAKCAVDRGGGSAWASEGDFEACIEHDPKP